MDLLKAKPGWGKIGIERSSRFKKSSDSKFTVVSLPDHCQYKYLLNLAGNACSTRYKYLFFCNSTIISPIKSGDGGHSGIGNQFEEFYYHRIKPDIHFLNPPSVDDLPQVVNMLRNEDIKANKIANAGTAWAMKELTKEGAWCYWANVIDIIAKLEIKGGALYGRNDDDPLSEKGYKDIRGPHGCN